MLSMTISDLRDASKVKACLEAGESIELREGSELVGRIVPDADRLAKTQPTSEAVKLPDFEARRKKLFGDRILNSVEEFLEYRHGRY